MTNISNLKAMKNEKGFTIVELLIVIIVIGILATLVLVAYNNVQGQARDTKRASNATAVANGAEQFKTGSLAGTYPRMDTGANFQADMNNGALYSNGTSAISIDSSVTATPGGANLLAVGAGVPTAANTSGLGVVWCPAGATQTTATGLKIYYWSEALKNASKFAQTGTGC